MTSITIHQGLFGYSEGHRLLASSKPISGAAGRLLRAISDMAFDGRTSSYLTVLPVVDLKAQAFIRSWAAPDWLRPGSVWSHVLLIDFVDLGGIHDITRLNDYFASPREAELDEPNWVSSYAQPIGVEIQTQHPVMAPVDSGDLARTLLHAAYSDNQPASLVADVVSSERILLAMHGQQWPRLRREFSYRTRGRASSNPSFQFDIEVVEKSRSSSREVDAHAEWIEALAADLEEPDADFRTLLRLFGAESSRGRRDMRGLVRVLQSALKGQASPSIVENVCLDFPNSMKKLKRALFGSPEATPKEFRRWPKDDLFRLALVLQGDASCLDLDDLQVVDRLSRAWKTRADDVVALVGGAMANGPSDRQVDLIVQVAARDASTKQIADLAHQNADFIDRIVRANPSLTKSPELWQVHSATPMLADVVASMGRKEQLEVLIALMDAEAYDAASTVCFIDPGLWWEAFFSAAKTGASSKSLSRRATALGELLNRLGPASLGNAPRRLASDGELRLLAAVADPQVGLWRRVPAREWVAIAETTSTSARGAQGEMNSRVFALCLIAATKGGGGPLRRKAWLASFPPLHQSLLSNKLDAESWRALKTILPREPEWDRAGRFRMAAVDAMFRDKWSEDEINTLIKAIPEYGKDVLEELQRREHRRKKSRGWLLDFIDDFFN